jgi:clan AA aspartic protease (TIGR02281 family)
VSSTDIAVNIPQQENTLTQPVDLRAYQTEQSLALSQIQIKEASTADLETLLRNGDYVGAIAVYDQQQDKDQELAAQRSRQAILKFAFDLHQSGATSQALALLNAYLESAYNDVDALQLKARLLGAVNDYERQIDVMYAAKSYAYQSDVIATIERAIRVAVDSYKQRLLQSQQYAALLALFQKLVYLEPDYAFYFLELARAQRLNQLDDDARQSLELVMFDPDVGRQAQQLLQEFIGSEKSDDQRVALVDEFQSVPLLRQGNHFVVEASMNGAVPLKLVIDTGASLTIIKAERLRAALNNNLGQYPQYSFSTANGVVRAPVITLNNLSIGEFEVMNLEVGGLSLVNTPDVDGLLGMNFLKHFRFFIDQQNNTLRLALVH